MDQCMDPTAPDIFLIHAGPDTAVAEKLYDLLSSSHKVFLDSKCLQPGDVWPDILQRVIKNARMSVILISQNTGPAFYQQSEIASAIQCFRDTKRRCVPVYIGGKPGKEVEFPYGLNIIHGIEADPSNFQPVAAKLRELLAATAAVPPQPVIRIISTDPDLGDARLRLAEHLKNALGISAVAEPVDPDTTLTRIDLLVLVQGFWWDTGRVANAWRKAQTKRRLAFISDPDADWPPRRLSEHREEDA